MNKNNSKCDGHMYPKKSNVKFLFFERLSVLSPIIAMIANIPPLTAKTSFCNIEHPYGR